MNTDQNNVGWGFWLAWVLASIVGYVLGALIAMSVPYALLPVFGVTEEFGIVHLVTFGTLLGAIGGCVQWAVLRGKIAVSGRWVLASALGFAIAGGTLGAIGIGETNENYVMAGILFAALFGIAGGIMQWLVLRQQFVRAGLWILASVFGSLVAALGIPASAAANAASDNYSMGAMVFGFFLGVGLGALPGGVLVWLLRQSPSSDVEGLAAAH
jgi:hypothetical protein